MWEESYLTIVRISQLSLNLPIPKILEKVLHCIVTFLGNILLAIHLVVLVGVFNNGNIPV